MPPADETRDAARWVYPLLTAVLGVLLLAFEVHDHGRTLDDAVQRTRGEATLAYVTSLDARWLPPGDLEDFSRGDRLYGPLGAAAAVLAGRLLAPLAGDPAAEKHLVFHTGLTLWFLLFFFCTLCLGRRFEGSVAGGVLAGLALLALPRVLGLATCNASDLPAAGAAALAVLALLRWIDRPSWPRAVCCCAALAAAAAVRPQNGATLLPIAACFVLPELRRHHVRLPRAQLVAAPAIAFAFWVLFWPDFWRAPLAEPWRVVTGFLEKGGRYTQGTLWFGEEAFGPKLYPVVWLGITTPLWILLPAVWGLAATRGRPFHLGLAAWVAVSAGKHLTGLGNFGGIRHFLDAFCPASIFAACGLVGLAARLTPGLATRVAAVVLAGAAGFARSLHPFESSYFNLLAGGTRGAAGRFDMEPNGASMLVLLRALAPRLDQNSVILVPGPADLVRQVPLPAGLLVYEIVPGNLDLLGDPALRQILAARRVYVVTVQDRRWGLFDRFTRDGLLRPVATTGPDGLPVGLALRVVDPGFYDRLGDLFR